MARSRKPPSAKERLRTFLVSRTGRWMLRGLGVAVLLLLGGVVVRQARARAWKLPAYRLGPSSVRYVGLHPKLGPLVERSLLAPSRLPFSVSVFDPHAEDTIREVVARHPMVATVRSVEIRYPDRVDVSVVVRQPVAWFEGRPRRGKKGFLLVSADGHLLEPRAYAHYRRRLPIPLPRVYGVSATAPDFYGQPWDDLPEQVAEGIAAARVAARLYREFNGGVVVRSIDVAAFPATPRRRRDGEVRFHLDDGTVVEWGRTERDLDGVAGEDPYETKRWRLEKELTRWGGSRRRKIDVRFRVRGEGDASARVR